MEVGAIVMGSIVAMVIIIGAFPFVLAGFIFRGIICGWRVGYYAMESVLSLAFEDEIIQIDSFKAEKRSEI